MFFPVFIIMVVFINVAYSKEFIATDFGKNKLVRMDDSFQPIKSYTFPATGMKINGFQVRHEAGDRLMLLWLNNSELVTRYMNSWSIRDLTNIQFEIDVVSFDVQSCGDNLVMTTEDGDQSTMFLVNLTNSNYSQILSHRSEYINAVTIHPTKLIVYYVLCKQKRLYFKVFDIEAKKELNSFALPRCLDTIAYDEKNAIMWAASGNQIYKSNLLDQKFELILEREAMIYSIAVGEQDLFIAHTKRNGLSVSSITLLPIVTQLIALPPFQIEPVMGSLTGGKMFILDIKNGLVNVYNSRFNKEWGVPIVVQKEPITSVFGFINSEGNVELYWTHDDNQGRMETVAVNSAGVAEGSRHTLEFPVQNIIDFSIEKQSMAVYVISNTSVYTGNINYAIRQQNVSLVKDIEESLTSITTLSTGIMMMTFCSKNAQGVVVLSLTQNELRYPTHECFQRIYYETNNLFLSSNHGIYTASPKFESILKLSDVTDQANLVVTDQVYFIADLSVMGPGVYKVSKIRSQSLWYSNSPFPNNYVTEIKGRCNQDNENKTDLSSPSLSPTTTKDHESEATRPPSQTTAKQNKKSNTSLSFYACNIDLLLICFAFCISSFL